MLRANYGGVIAGKLLVYGFYPADSVFSHGFAAAFFVIDNDDVVYHNRKTTKHVHDYGQMDSKVVYHIIIYASFVGGHKRLV